MASLRPLIPALALIPALSGAPTGTPYAGEPPGAEPSPFTLTGFGTLGLARSDDEAVQFVRDLSQPDGPTRDWSAKIDSVLGVQAGYRFSDRLEGVVQAISRYRYDGSHRPEVSWAFLRFDPNPNLNLRLGRLGTEFYMLADSRLVGYSNLTVRPPPDLFNTLIFSYFDGLDAGITLPVGDGLVRAKLFGGVSPETNPYLEPWTWDLGGSRILGGHVDYFTGPWQFRLSHSRVRFAKSTPDEAIVDTLFGLPGLLTVFPQMAVAGTWSAYTAFGAVYDRGPLQVQFMIDRVDHESSANEDVRAGYLIAGYRLGAWTPYLGYSRVESKAETMPRHPPPLNVYDLVMDAWREVLHADQQSLFLGARWDVARNVALKAQVDWIDGRPSSRSTFREGDGSPWDGNMAVYSLSLDFVY